MPMLKTVLTAAVIALAASQAQAFLASNDLRVDATAQGFAVRVAPGLSASEAWCAAGDFAQHELGLAQTDRIWRQGEPTRRQGEGVAFGTGPDGAASRTGLLIWGPHDGSLTVATAQALCSRGEIEAD